MKQKKPNPKRSKRKRLPQRARQSRAGKTDTGLTEETRLYLHEALESQWNQDSEYSATRDEKRAAWLAQNEVRVLVGIEVLSEGDLEGSYDDKLTRTREDGTCTRCLNP